MMGKKEALKLVIELASENILSEKDVLDDLYFPDSCEKGFRFVCTDRDGVLSEEDLCKLRSSLETLKKEAVRLNVATI